MKLDPTLLRYLSKEDFRVLVAIEMGMKNHAIVPTELIVCLAGLRHGGVEKFISNIARAKLVYHDKSVFDGYKLTYLGYDYLALNTMCKRGTVASVGRQIGVGKESDIYEVGNSDGEVLCLKLHRLGRVSFKTIKNKRDYLQNRTSASWLYLSRIAAIKEYAFMKALYEHGFPTPVPIDQNRHTILMSLAKGYTLYQIKKLGNPGKIYDAMMDLILKLAEHGLIHCDFNEYNVLIDDDENLTLIDFPQMISTDHENAEFYFKRDVMCVVHFFERKHNYKRDLHDGHLPELNKITRSDSIALDVEMNASGFNHNDNSSSIRNMFHFEELMNSKRLNSEETALFGDEIPNEKEVKVESCNANEKEVDSDKTEEPFPATNIKNIIHYDINTVINANNSVINSVINSNNKSVRTCHTCGLEGHIARKCVKFHQLLKEQQKENEKISDADSIKDKALVIKCRIKSQQIKSKLMQRSLRNKSSFKNKNKSKTRQKLFAEVREGKHQEKF